MLGLGRMDRRLSLYRALETDDGLATIAGPPAVLAEVWAERLPISDGERGSQAGLLASATVRFRCLWSRRLRDLNPKDSASCEGRAYDILGVKEIGRRAALEITCAERTDD